MVDDHVIKVAVADDHQLMREGMARIIATADDIDIVVSVDSGAALLDALQTAAVDVCVLDISMPGIDGVETLRRMRLQHPDLPVLMCTMHDDLAFGARCVHEGANGFLTKGAAPADFLAAIRKVRAGQAQLSNELLDHLLRRSPECQLPHQRLSAREFQVFIRLARGLTNAEITRELHLDQRTVSAYRRRVLDKMGLDRNAELVEYAIRQQLIA